MGFDGNVAMGPGGGEAFDLSQLQQQIQVTRQITDSPLKTEATVLDKGNETIEINFLVAESGEFVARTYRVGGPGIESIKAAISELEI